MLILTTSPTRRERIVALMDDRDYCIVPSCGVRSRVLDRHGMCPPHLWDVKHDRYYAALKLPATRRRRVLSSWRNERNKTAKTALIMVVSDSTPPVTAVAE